MKCFYCSEITDGEHQLILNHRNKNKTILHFCDKQTCYVGC